MSTMMVDVLVWFLVALAVLAPLLLGAAVGFFIKGDLFMRRWGLSTVVSLLFWILGIFLLWKLVEYADFRPDPGDVHPHNLRSLVADYGVWAAPLVPLGALIISLIRREKKGLLRRK